MTVRMVRIAFVSGILGMSGIALAQVPGEVLKQQIATTDQARQARRVLAGGVQCLLDQRPSNVRSFLKQFPETKDSERAATYLNKGDCVDGSSGGQQMRFGESILRGAIYRAMYIRDFSNSKTDPDLGAAPDYTAESRGQAPAVVKNYVADRRFAECVIKAKPNLARDYVLAEPEGQAEFDALATLQPTIESCTPQNRKAAMTRSTVSGLVSEVLYRMSKSGTGANA